jgi:hypothetical protein
MLKVTIGLFAAIAALSAVAPPPLPKVVLEARTVFVYDRVGDLKVYDNVYDKLRKWGRWVLVQDAESADLVIVLSGDVITGGMITNSSTTGNANATVYGNTATVNGRSSTTTTSMPMVLSLPRYLTIVDRKTRQPLLSVSCEQRIGPGSTAGALVNRLKGRFPADQRKDTVK